MFSIFEPSDKNQYEFFKEAKILERFAYLLDKIINVLKEYEKKLDQKYHQIEDQF